MGILRIFGEPWSGVTSGHAATLYDIDNDHPDPNFYRVRIMDPSSGEIIDPFYYVVYNGTGFAAPWYGSFCLSDLNCPSIPISDISNFWYVEQTQYKIKLGYRLAHTADPADSIAVYISDNPLGPARLIRALVEKPLSAPPDPYYDGWINDYYRLAYKSDYYYFLDFDTGPFAPIRSPDELYHNVANPIYWDGNDWWWEDRPVLDAPSNLTVTDVPFDFGTALEITWVLSADDSVLHQYNIYREGDGAEYEYVTFVPSGTSSYTDYDVAGPTTYKISSAHSVSQSQMYGNIGIWNDFSEEASGQAVHNYYYRNISLICGDTLFVCPAGDEDTLKVEFEVLGSDSNPTVGIPADRLVLYAIHGDTTHFCLGDTVGAEHDTDQYGKTEYNIANIGGAGIVKLVAHIKGTYYYTDTLSVVVKSPDLFIQGYSRGIVNIIDLGIFSCYYSSDCGDANYYWLYDYNGDCTIDIVDLALFSDHWLDQCSQ